MTELDSISRAAHDRPLTIVDVARASGVGTSTVSRALSGRGYVAADVRDRVLKIAEELGYVPDLTARRLKQQVSLSIGLIVSDLRNPFYADLAAGVSQKASENGFTMILSDDGGQPTSEEDVAREMVALRVAGVIATPVSAGLHRFLKQHNVPLVEVSRLYADGECDGVSIDNAGASYEVTKHLLGLGHRRIALLINRRWTTGQTRVEGYVKAMTEAGFVHDERLIVEVGGDGESAQRVAAEILASPDRPTAIFAANNLLGEAAWRAAQDEGLQVPAQLSLAVFDESRWMTMVRPGITAVDQRSWELGEKAAALLLDRLQEPSKPVVSLTIPFELIIRGSTAPPAR